MEDSTNQSTTPQPENTTPVSKNSSKKSKLAVPIIAGIVLLSGVGAAAFNASIQNTPEKIWEDALQNTEEGFESFADTAENYDAKGLKIDGSFNLQSPLSADGQVTGALYEKNATVESSIGVAGLRVESEIRSIVAEGSDTPDLYVYLDGLDAVQGLLGAAQPEVGGIIEDINDQWIVIDRTLINQSLEQIEEETTINADSIMLDRDDVSAISQVSSTVIADYVFTTDLEKAIFQVADELGEEEFQGVDTYKYAVTLNKENLKAFLTAYKDALKETQFDEYIVGASEGDESFEDIIEFDELMKSIDDLDTSKTVNEAWVDLDTRLIRNIRITPTEQDPGTVGYIEFALPYDGGDVLPLTFRLNTGIEEATGNEIIAEFVAGYNQSDTSFALSFDISGTVGDDDIDVEATLNITPSNEEVNPEKPDGAKNILEIVGQLQGFGLPAEFNQPVDSFDESLFDNIEL